MSVSSIHLVNTNCPTNMDPSHSDSQDREALPPRGDERGISTSLDREKSLSPVDQPDAPPDGGLTAWLVVVGAWCTSFCSFGWVNSECLSTVMKYLKKTSKLTVYQVSGYSRITMNLTC